MTDGSSALFSLSLSSLVSRPHVTTDWLSLTRSQDKNERKNEIGKDEGGNCSIRETTFSSWKKKERLKLLLLLWKYLRNDRISNPISKCDDATDALNNQLWETRLNLGFAANGQTGRQNTFWFKQAKQSKGKRKKITGIDGNLTCTFFVVGLSILLASILSGNLEEALNVA